MVDMSAPTAGIATLKGALSSKVAKEGLKVSAKLGQKEPLVAAFTADDETEMAELVDLLTAAKSVLGRERGTRARILRELLPVERLAVSPAVLEQVQRNAQAQAEL